MTCIAKTLHLGLWIGASEQRSVSRRYRRVIIGFDDENFSRPSPQVIRRKLGLVCELKQAFVLMYKNIFQQKGGNCFVQVSAPKLRFRMVGGAERREQHFIKT